MTNNLLLGDKSSVVTMQTRDSEQLGGEGSLFQCPVCQKRYTRAWVLKGHMRTHTGVKPYKCPFAGCKYEYADR